MAKVDKTLTAPPVATVTNMEEEEHVVVLRYDDNLVLSRERLLAPTPLKAAESGVVIYILALLHERPEDELSIFHVLEHFNHDPALDILYTLKSLQTKGMLKPNAELDEALHKQLWERDNSQKQKPN